MSLSIGELVGTHHPSVDDILEMLVQERRGIDLYRRLLALAEGRSVSLEELARQMIRNEELDIAEIEKMLRKRGDAKGARLFQWGAPPRGCHVVGGQVRRPLLKSFA